MTNLTEEQLAAREWLKNDKKRNDAIKAMYPIIHKYQMFFIIVYGLIMGAVMTQIEPHKKQDPVEYAKEWMEEMNKEGMEVESITIEVKK